MLVELGLYGYISLRSHLEPEKLIILCPTDTLDPIAARGSTVKIDSLEPIGHFGDSDPMKMPVPGFCVHPSHPPTQQEEDCAEWVWFAATPDGGAWQIILSKTQCEEHAHYGCQFLFYENPEAEEESVFVNCGLFDYADQHEHCEDEELDKKTKLSLVN